MTERRMALSIWGFGGDGMALEESSRKSILRERRPRIPICLLSSRDCCCLEEASGCEQRILKLRAKGRRTLGGVIVADVTLVWKDNL